MRACVCVYAARAFDVFAHIWEKCNRAVVMDISRPTSHYALREIWPPFSQGEDLPVLCQPLFRYHFRINGNPCM
jgi:hypothetical protein